MFKLYANKNQLTVRQREPLTSGSVNAYTALFEFSDDWTGMARVAVFQSAAGPPVPVLLDETGICTIPWETLTKPYVQLKVGVRGTIGSEIVLTTIWANLGTILDGVSGGGNPDPTPDLWEQELATKIGSGLKIVDGKLTVNTTDDFKGDNTLPMTAAGVETVVGNIEALLSTI